MSERACLYCKKSIPETMNKAAIYCGKLCRHMAGYYNAKGMSAPGPIEPRNCKWCENEFTPKKQRAALYCCERCKVASTNHNYNYRNASGNVSRGISPRQERRNREILREEVNEWSLERCRKHYGLDQREPAKPVAKSLAECESMKGK